MYFDSRVPAGMVGKDGNPLFQDLFFASVDFTTGVAKSLGVKGGGSDVQQSVLTIDQDAHLLIVGGARVGTDTATDATLQAFLPVLCTLRMVSSGRDLMNAPQHLENLFGTAQLPAAWPRPKFLAAGSSVRVTLQNLSAATAFNVRLTFYAFKIFLDS